MSKHKKLSIEFLEQTIDELNEEEKSLLKKAQSASKLAYAPYSNFHVGAAVLLSNGEIITGNNQENAAYPSGLCAERVAVFKASADYPETSIKTIAITASSKTITIDKPVSPCGGCRQVLKEYESKFKNKIRIILSGEKTNKVHIIHSIEDLLPFSFSSDDLEK